MPSTSSLILAASLALASTVAAEPAQRPRIYYPQRVKRDYGVGASRANIVPEHAAAQDEKRGLLDDLINDLMGQDPKDFGNGFDNGNDNDNDHVAVKTVVVSRTMVIPPKGTGNHPGETVLPTTKKVPVKPTKRPKPTTDSSGILVGPTGVIVPGTSFTEITPTATPSTPDEDTKTSSTKGGILDPIKTIITELLPGPTSPANETTPSAESTSSKNGSSPVSPSGSDSPSAITSGTPIKETTVGGLPPILTSLLPIPGTTSSEPIVNVTSVETPTGTPTDTTIVTPPTGTPTDGTEIPDTTTSTPVVTPTTSALPPPVNETSTETPVPPVTSSTELPATNTTETLTPVTTPTTTVIQTPPVNGTVIAPTDTTSVQLPPTTLSTPVVTPTTTEQAVTSVKPTATATNTENWLPTTIVVEPTTFSFSAPTGSDTATSSKTLPTGIPKIILPDDSDKPPPPGSVPIQIGFFFPLNYDFVASNTVAAAQIFTYLPKALADAGGISVDKVQVSKLVPMDSRDEWGYITTIAKLHYPETLVDTLKVNMWAPNSKLYNNDLGLVRNLTAVINPKIDLLGDVDDEDINSEAGSNKHGDNDAFDSGDQSSHQSSKQKATTAGIAVGAFGLSVMYGAAMFIVARRYKRKRQGHRRSSSVSGSQASEEMRFNGTGSPALMGGALLGNQNNDYGGMNRDSPYTQRGGAARNANISAPVTAENSLGWN